MIGGTDHHRLPPGPGPAPALEGLVEHDVALPAHHPTMLEVLLHDAGVAVSQAQAGVALPLGVEPAHPGELG